MAIAFPIPYIGGSLRGVVLDFTRRGSMHWKHSILAALILSAAFVQTANAGGRPNVVLILSDDQAYNDVDDPDEQKNLVSDPQFTAVAAELRNLLDDWWKVP